MLRLSIVKSPEETELRAQENPKPWHKWDDLTHGGKVLLDLVEPWLGTGRIVGGDSAFSSVKLAEKCEEYNTGLIGSIKQATTGFPMRRLSTVESTGKRGGPCPT